MSEIFLSFIIPVYNAENYLERCLDSILKQKINEKMEIILIDDGSIDKSGEICDRYKEKYADKIIVIHQNNRGQGNARNTGVGISRGKWLLFIDNDDWLEDTWASWCMPELYNEDIDIILFGKKDVFSRTSKEYVLENISDKYMITDVKEKRELLLTILNTCHKSDIDYRLLSVSTPWGKIYKSQLIKNNNCRFSESYGEDRPFVLNAFECATSYLIINKSLYNYYIHESSMRKYLCNAAEKYNNSVKDVQKFIKEKYANDTEFLNAFYHHNIAYFSYYVKQDFCNVNNPNSYKIRKKEFIKARNEAVYEESFQKADICILPFKRGILANLIKNKQFVLMNILMYIYSLYEKKFLWDKV